MMSQQPGRRQAGGFRPNAARSYFTHDPSREMMGNAHIKEETPGGTGASTDRMPTAHIKNRRVWLRVPYAERTRRSMTSLQCLARSVQRIGRRSLCAPCWPRAGSDLP